MANYEYLRLESTNNNTQYNILVGYGHFLSRTDPNSGTFQIDKRGENFYEFMSQHGGETFKIVGTNTQLKIREYNTGDTTYPILYQCDIVSKNKNGAKISATDFISRITGSSPIPKNFVKVGCQLIIDTDSNALLNAPYLSFYKVDRNVNPYLETLIYDEAPYQCLVNGNKNLYNVDNVYYYRYGLQETIPNYNFTRYFTTEFTSYSNLAIGTNGGSCCYCALRNYDDNPNTGKPNESPIYIQYGFPGKPSEPQGGDGDMKDTNDPVALNPSDITNVAYPVRCYRLSRANVSALHGYLWSTDFITNLPKLFSDPFSAIVGIQAIPYISPTEESNIIIGTLDTNIVANKVTLYYVTVDLGSIDVTEYWQNFLDYQPYTRLKLFLPYIGIVDLPTDLFMNNSVAVKYRIDIVSGACVAIVSNSENIICTFTGNCSTKIPLSNNDHSNAIGNTLVGIAGLAGSVATGNAVGAVANTASIVAGLKERIQISGSLSTAHGILINDKPFLMIERPDTEIPENYAGLKGYTSNISMKLSESSGFTKIADIKLDGLSCTDAEKEELLNMMQNGIYL